jgi:hypothetical protein
MIVHDSTRVFWDAMHQVLVDNEDFLPMTVRGVYYKLVAAQVIENEPRSYNRVVRELTKAREQDFIPWDWIADPTRKPTIPYAWLDTEQFLTAWKEQTLRDYRRDILQSQDVALEVWVEKETLRHVIERGIGDYPITVVSCRGYPSTTAKYDALMRMEKRAKNLDQQTMILYFGDHDPSGLDMPKSTGDWLHEQGAELRGFNRCAITLEQVKAYALIPNRAGDEGVGAAKPGDTRYAQYVEQCGTDDAWELDAFDPGDLADLVQQHIEAELDVELVDHERRHADEDKKLLGRVREAVVAAADGVT